MRSVLVASDDVRDEENSEEESEDDEERPLSREELKAKTMRGVRPRGDVGVDCAAFEEGGAEGCVNKVQEEEHRLAIQAVAWWLDVAECTKLCRIQSQWRTCVSHLQFQN